MLPKKIWVQMAAVLVVLVSGPLMTLGAILISTSRTAVKASVLRDHEQLAIRAASEVNEFVKKPHDLLNATAAILGITHADLWKQETVLVELALNESIFGRISLVDPKGKETATSEVGTPLKDRFSETVFKKALGNEAGMSDVMFSEDHMPYVTVGVPVRQLGNVAGVLIAEVDLRQLWDTVDNIKIGHTGRAYVVSEKGILIAHEDKKRVLANENMFSRPAVREALRGNAGSTEYQSGLKQKWLEAYAPIRDLGWGMVVQQSTAEAFAFSIVMQWESWALIILSVVVSIAISVPLARTLVKPIRTLVRATELVAQGDFSQQIPVKRSDEIGRLIEAFNEMTRKLKKAREAERLASVGKAAAAIAHELKNSIVMASAYIGLLPKRSKDKEFLDKFSKVVPAELENWKSLLQEISDYSRHSEFEMGSLRVNDLLSHLKFLIEERLRERQVALDFRVTPNLPSIRGNAQKLNQVLMNLVTNAIDAMPDGGLLKIEAQAQNENVTIKIEDNGKGIPPENLDKIFEPFYTTKSQGLGLGLSIVRTIMEQHGGRVDAYSEPGQGTSFILVIPGGVG